MAEHRLITVASRVPMAIQMKQVETNPAEPGKTAQLEAIVINGSGDDGTTEGITRNVNEEIFDAWMAENANHPAVVNGLLRKVPDGEVADPTVYGFEPALAVAEEQQKQQDEDPGADEDIPALPLKSAPAALVAADDETPVPTKTEG